MEKPPGGEPEAVPLSGPGVLPRKRSALTAALFLGGKADAALVPTPHGEIFPAAIFRDGSSPGFLN